MMDVWPIAWGHSSIAGDGSVGLVEWLLKLTVSPEPAAKSCLQQVLLLVIPVLPHYLQSLLLPLLTFVCAWLWGPRGLICTCSVLIASKPSATLVTQPLRLLWPATEFEEWSSQTSSFTGSCRQWTLWRKDFWCFFLLWSKGKQAN